MVQTKEATVFKAPARRAETLMDKISRAAMEIVDEESKEREIKTLRLRKARLEREENGAKYREAPSDRTGTRRQ